MSVMSNPIPAAIDDLSDSGTAATICSRNRNEEVAIKIRPDMNIAPSAASHATPAATTAAKKKLCPMAGATAMG
jgi:hypothetical protein